MASCFFLSLCFNIGPERFETPAETERRKRRWELGVTRSPRKNPIRPIDIAKQQLGQVRLLKPNSQLYSPTTMNTTVTVNKTQFNKLKKDSAELPKVQKKYDDEKTKHDATKNELAGKKTEIVQLNFQLTTVKGEKSELENNVKDLATEKNSLEDQVTTQLTSDNADLSTKVSELETNARLVSPPGGSPIRTREGEDLPDDVTELQELVGQERAANGKLVTDLTAKSLEVDSLNHVIGLLEKAVRLASESKENRIKALASDLKLRVRAIVKDKLTRNWVFIENEQESSDATTEVYGWLQKKDKEELPEPVFVAMYYIHVENELQNERGNIQDNCKKAAQGTHSRSKFVIVSFSRGQIPTDNFFQLFVYTLGITEWWAKHGKTPSVEEIFTMFNMDARQLDADTTGYNKELMLWYFDKYLPCVATKNTWEPEHRLEHFPTSLHDFHGMGQKIRVTNVQEAFGLLLLDNCEDKWPKMFQWKKDNPGREKRVPRGNKGEATAFQAKYSNCNSGAKNYGGWAENTVDQFNGLMDRVMKWKEVQESCGWECYKNFQAALKAAKAADATATPSTTSKSTSAKKPARAPRPSKRRKMQE